MNLDGSPVPYVTGLTADTARTVFDLAQKVQAADGVAAFNEASLLAVEAAAGTGVDRARFWLVYADEVTQSHSGPKKLIAAAVDADGDAASVDLAVDPTARRNGVGLTLVRNVLAVAPRAGFWAHGDLPAARALAEHQNLTMVRDLWRMERPLAGENGDETNDLDATLPDGFVARGFDGSREQAEAWLDVNARAFVHHPEQGKMTLDDFNQRASEDWFDPAGLILVWDTSVTPARLAASHWTKREPNSSVGEVYVVAVAPEYQGRGLARPVTNLGLTYLAQTGAATVELYVEGDNEPAKATYVHAGFTQAAHDALYTSA